MTTLFDKLNLRPGERRLVVVVAFAVFVVLNYWLIWPHFGDLQKTQTATQTIEETQTAYRKKIDKIPELEQQLARLKEGGAYIPEYDRKSSLQRIVDLQARESGVVISQRRPAQQAGSDENFLEEVYTITVRTEDEALVDFLVELGSGDSMIRVRDMTFKPNTDQTRLEGTITLVASYLKTDEFKTAEDRSQRRDLRP